MVRTYWLVPVFNEASGHLDLQPFARTDRVEACRPRAMCNRLYGVHDAGATIRCDRDRRRRAGRGLRRAARRLPRLRHAVASYPTRSEIWLELIEAYGL